MTIRMRTFDGGGWIYKQKDQWNYILYNSYLVQLSVYLFLDFIPVLPSGATESK